MEAVFLKLANLSITAGWLVLAILVVRLVFRRAPRWSVCLLWGLVGLRLICPLSIESTLSLIPNAQPLPPEIRYTATPRIDSGIDAVNSVVNPILARALTPGPMASANPTQIWSFLLSWVWIMGMAGMVLYGLISCLLLRRRVSTATLLRENIRQSERVDSPFVLGLIRPVIYLPYRIEKGDLEHVIAHEQAHIRRRDHWWKPLGFLLLSIYWFHPLLWVAYVLLCRDIEAACDEKVAREMGSEERRGYATALLNCSIRRRRVTACPLAFGEVGVKERVTAVMRYRKPARWLTAAALAVCAIAAVCFLTDPKSFSEEICFSGRVYLRQGEAVEALPQGSYEVGRLNSILHHTNAHPQEDFSGTNLEEKYAGNLLYQSGTEADVIYLEDLAGYYLPFRTEQGEGGGNGPASGALSEPVAWTYSPMMSATWHAAFHFYFELEYSHIEASCDNGMLRDFSAEGQPRGKTLQFQAGQPVCWAPISGETLEELADWDEVRFTVYQGEEALWEGTLDIRLTGTNEGQSFYEARLADTGQFTLQPEANSARICPAEEATATSPGEVRGTGE